MATDPRELQYRRRTPLNLRYFGLPLGHEARRLFSLAPQSKSAVADFDPSYVPKSGKPDFGRGEGLGEAAFPQVREVKRCPS
jgi:hypothetical protein